MYILTHVEQFVGVGSMEWVHIPIQDETAPTDTQIQQFVSLIDKAEREGVVRCSNCWFLYEVLSCVQPI